MILKLVIIVALLSGMSFLMRKGRENRFGYYMGKMNNERWGMEDEEKYDK